MKRRAEDAFTLPELLVVVVVIAILAAVVVTAVGRVTRTAASTVCRANAHQLEQAAAEYYAVKGEGAPDLRALITAGFLRATPAITAALPYEMTVAGQTVAFAPADPPQAGPGTVDSSGCSSNDAIVLAEAAAPATVAPAPHLTGPAVLTVSPKMARVGGTITATVASGTPQWGAVALVGPGRPAAATTRAESGGATATFAVSTSSTAEPVLVPVAGCGPQDQTCTWRVVSGSDDGEGGMTWLALQVPVGSGVGEDFVQVAPQRYAVDGHIAGPDGLPLSDAGIDLRAPARTVTTGPGDTAATLADRFEVPLAALLAANPGLPAIGPVGARSVRIPPAVIAVATSAGGFRTFLPPGAWTVRVPSAAGASSAAVLVVPASDVRVDVRIRSHKGPSSATTTTSAAASTSTTSTTASSTSTTTSSTTTTSSPETTSTTAPSTTTTSTTAASATTTSSPPATTTTSTVAMTTATTATTDVAPTTLAPPDAPAPPSTSTTSTATSTTSTPAAPTTTPSSSTSTSTSGPTSSTSTTAPPSSPPAPVCSWVLADMSYGDGAFAYTDANGYSSDDPLALPTPVPCTLGSDGPAQVPAVHHTIAIRPNPGDSPSPRRVELWGEATPAATIDRAWWAVFRPDGEPAAKVDGERVAPAGCVGPIGMYAAAQRTGQLGQAVVDATANGLVSRCGSGQAALYHTATTVPNGEPCGEYRVEFHVHAANQEAVLTSFIDVTCTIQMDVGFSDVEWGQLSPNAMLKGRPKASEHFSVGNLGNASAALTVDFGPLTTPNGDRIASFGVGLEVGGSRVALVDPVTAGTPVTFSGAGELLRAGATASLQLFLHVGARPTVGTYSGQLTLVLSALPP